MRQFANTVQNQPIDTSEEFAKQENHFFIASKIEEFDRNSASGKIRWQGQALKQRVSYHQLTPQFADYKVWEDVPPGEYEDEQNLPFSVSFITPRTVRLQASTQIAELRE
jgi:alpha-D-xyloside xylohydrolase